MNWIEALLLGVLQGLTEFLPVSSSGHLELGQSILNTNYEENLSFAIVVHGATVLSTVVVFFTEIRKILTETFSFQWNDSKRFVTLILVSMIPVAIIGVFFKENVESLYTGNVKFVGFMLLITAGLLSLTVFVKNNQKEITWWKAFMIGIMQAIAVIPGISRSGATISAALLLGVKKELATRFSFLMVLIPILGANLLDLFKYSGETNSSMSGFALMIGFIGAFTAGLFACKVMISLVKRGRLIYFAIYCAIVGIIAVLI